MDWLLDPIKFSFSVVFFKVETTELGVIMRVPQETCAEHEELQWFLYFVATSATVTEHETLLCLDIHNLRMDMVWKIQKKTLSPAKNPQQIQFLNQLATHEGLDQDSIHTNQWNITVLGALSLFTWIQKKTYPLDHQIRPSTLEQTLKAIRKKSFWAKKVFQVSTAYLPNSIKPLPSKCFRHTFRQLKAWLRDWTNLFFVSSLQDTDIFSFGFTKLRNTFSGHQLAWIPWGQRMDGIDGIDSQTEIPNEMRIIEPHSSTRIVYNSNFR